MRVKKLLMLFLFIFCFALLATGATLHVPSEYASIQAAIDASNNGDTILVADGIYTENVAVDKELTIQSQNGPDNCIVQAASYASSVFKVTSNNVSIIGFTAKNGGSYDRPTDGAGVTVYEADNCVINNVIAVNNYVGIMLAAASNNQVINCICLDNTQYSIWLFGVNAGGNNTVSGSTFSGSVGGGICEQDSASLNTFTGNVVYNNRAGIIDDGGITYSSNHFSNNITTNQMLAFGGTGSRIRNVDDTISFNVTARNSDGTACNGCTTVTTYPSETIVHDNDWDATNNPQGHFTVSKSGTYSLVFTVNDADSNTTEKGIRFFVESTTSATKKYYFRKLRGTHRQDYSPSQVDSYVLLSDPPTESNEWNCARWIQNSPDEIPNYPLAILSDIDIYAWYTIDDFSYPSSIGAERRFTYTQTVNTSVPIPVAASYTWNNTNLTGLNWAMDYPWYWYWLSLKLIGTLPYWVTFPAEEGDADPASWAAHHHPDGTTDPSYADFTYQYTTTPAIKSISDDNIIVLSATADADDTGVISVILEDSSTSDTSTMDIVLSSPVRLDLSFDAWDTATTYYKQWIEEASEPGITAVHTISGFAPNNYYAATKDGSLVGLYLSDAAGRITFEAVAGSVFVIVGVDTVFDINNDSDSGSSPKCFIATAAYGTPAAGEVMLLRHFRDNYLVTNSIGEAFVAAYYKVSPPIADFIREHPLLRKIIRITLNPLIWLSDKLADSTAN